MGSFSRTFLWYFSGSSSSSGLSVLQFLVSDVYPLLSVGLTMKVLNDVLYARVDQGRDGLEVPAGGNRLDLSQTCRVVSHHSGSSAIMRRIFRGSAAGFFVSL